MKHNLNRVLSTLALLLLTCIGLWAGEVIKVVKPANAGTVVSTVSDGVCTLTVTPATGYYLTADNLKAVVTLNESGMQAPRRDMPIDPGTELDITPTDANANPSGVTTYTFNLPEDENLNVEVTAEFQAGSCYYLRIGGLWVTSENAEDILDDLYDDDHDGTMSFDAENKRLIISDVGEWPFDIESGLDALTIKVSGENKFYSESNAAISYIGNGQGTLTLVKDEQATVCSLELLSYTNNKSAISGFGSFNYDGFYVHSDVSGVVYDTNSKTLNDATGAPVNSVKFSTVETYYDLWYEYGDDRIQVTNENQDDITGDENEQGEPQVSFRYDPETKRNILTLNSAVLTGTFATTISPIYINLNGTNVVTESAGTFLRYEGYLDVADAIYTTTSSSPTTLTFDNCVALQGMRASYQNGLALIQSPTDNQPAIVGSSYAILIETADAVHHVTALNCSNVLEEVDAVPSVKFDGHKKLILNNAYLTGILCNIDDLEIFLQGNSTIVNNSAVIEPIPTAFNGAPRRAGNNLKVSFNTDGNVPGDLTYRHDPCSTKESLTIVDFFPGFDVKYTNKLAATLTKGTPVDTSNPEDEGTPDEVIIKVPLGLIIDDVPSTSQQTTTTISYGDVTSAGITVTTALTNLIANNMLYTLDDKQPEKSDDGYDQTTNQLVINSTMTDAAVAALHADVIAGNVVPGTDAYAERFKGLTFVVPAGMGAITLNTNTDEGYEFHLKIGGQDPIKVINKTDNSNADFVTSYTVTTSTYVYFYLVATGVSSAPAYAQAVGGHRIGPKSSVAGGLGGISVQGNTINVAPDPAASYLMMTADDCSNHGRGIKVNNPDVTDLPPSAFSGISFVSPSPRRAPDANMKTYIDASGTMITGKNFSRTEGAFKDVPEETLIYLPAGNTAVGKNFIIGGICEEMELKAKRENPFEAAADFTAAKATFDRVFDKGDDKYYTIFLPYALNVSEVDGELFEYVSYNSATKTVNMSKLTAGATTPNKAYIFKPSKTAALKPMLNKQVKKLTGTVANPSSESEAEGLHGVYEYYKWTSKPSNVYCYSASDKGSVKQGQFAKVGVNTHIKPFRAYLRLNTSSAPEFISVDWGNGLTSIVPIEKEQVHQDADGWYTITGFRLPNKPTEKGIYIHNHKKTVVK